MTVRTITEFRVKDGEAERFERTYRAGQFLERATTNPGFLRGEFMRCVADPSTFVAIAEWQSEGDYAAWQAAYESLPRVEMETMLETLADAPASTVHRVLLTADQNTEVRP
ncbi:antibiotic biosynthesis monooxygenase family protein [Candidatus Poriferisodalis sp.]|uniref:antibiotic biosynthesis monooxygenase family protein n=1 Tax=Candidatus Poriferisodalis sp. TaxID=3101277 RepID=UPI003B024447